MSSNINTDSKYIPGLDALRGLACLSVVLFHTNFVTKSQSPWTPFKGGAYGVDLFFVLSGFLIASILLNEYGKYSTINFKAFYIRRILRLYPPILISVVVFLVPILFTDKPTAIANIVSLMTYTGDCFMIIQHFTHLPYALLSGHSWSLAVEEQFYLTFPFLLLIVLRIYNRKKNSSFISWFPVFLLLYLSIVIVSSILLGKWFYKFFLWRFFEIYLGTFIAMIYSQSYRRITAETPFSQSIKNIVQKAYSNRIALSLSILLSICLIVYPTFFPAFMGNYHLQYVLFTLAASILIINAVYPRYKLYSKFLSNKVFIFLGKISYGFYLYTPFISDKVGAIVFGSHPFKNTRTMVTCDIITISTSLIFSSLSFFLIEKNILKLKHRLDRPQKAASEEPHYQKEIKVDLT